VKGLPAWGWVHRQVARLPPKSDRTSSVAPATGPIATSQLSAGGEPTGSRAHAPGPRWLEQLPRRSGRGRPPRCRHACSRRAASCRARRSEPVPSAGRACGPPASLSPRRRRGGCRGRCGRRRRAAEPAAA
jgi:hypothetical protein